MSKYRKWVWLFAVMMLLTAMLGQVAHSTGSMAVSDRGPIVNAIGSPGGHNTAFTTAEGYVYVNGDNAYGLRGDNTTTTPSTDDGKKTFQQVTTNGSTALAGIDNLHATNGNVIFAWDEGTSKLYAWGSNTCLKAGISSQTGSTVNAAKEVNFLGASITFEGEKTQQIAVTASTVGVIDASGDVWTWGAMSTASATPASRVIDYRLGRNPGTPNTADQTDTVSNDTDSDGIVTDANYYCSITPAKISLTFDTGEKAVAIGAGDSKTFYILTNLGKLYAWGGSEMSPSSNFTEITHPNAANGDYFVKMACSNGGALGLIDNDGAIYVSNVASVSSANVTPAKPDAIYHATTGNPTAAACYFYSITAFGATGNAGFIGIEGNRKAYVWGSNNNGMCAMGNATSPTSYTTATENTSLESSEAVAASYVNGVLVKNNTLYTWGMNTKGQLANGTVGTTSATPTACSTTYTPSYVDNWASPTVTPTVTTKPNPNAWDFIVNDNMIHAKDVTIGAQYNQNLYTDLTEVMYGIDSTNVGTLETILDGLDLHSTRIFYDPDPEALKYYDSTNQGLGQTQVDPGWASFRDVVALANGDVSDINITYWHSAADVNVIRNMHTFANEIYYLRKTLGYTHVNQVTIQNEPNGYGVDIDRWETAYRAFDEFCKDLGIRDEITVVAGDLVSSSQTTWFDRMGDYMSGIVDEYSSHIYWDHWDKAYANTRLTDIDGIVDGFSAYYKMKPKTVTEFGVRGYDRTGYVDPGASVATGTPVYAMCDYIRGAFQNAWFMMSAYNLGFRNMVRWDAFRAKYDGGSQDYSLIGHGDDSFDKRPYYYMMWLFTHAVNDSDDWNVVNAQKYDPTGNPDEHCTVFRKQGTGARVIFLANTQTSGQRTIYVGGLPVSTTYNLYRWNWSATGAITSAGTIATNVDGRLGVVMNPESIAVVTADTISGW